MKKGLKQMKPKAYHRQHSRQDKPLVGHDLVMSCLGCRARQFACQPWVRVIGLHDHRQHLHAGFLAKLRQAEILPNLGRP